MHTAPGLKCAAHGLLEMQDAKSRQKGAIWAPSHNFVGLYLRNWGTYRQSEKDLLNSNVRPARPHNMINFGALAAEICWQVLATPANFNGFRILAALLHGTLVVGVSQTLQHWTEGPPIFSRAAITLGIGPHSSLNIVFLQNSLLLWGCDMT